MEDKEQHQKEGHRPFLSVLSSVWRGHGDTSVHEQDGNLSRQSSISHRSSASKRNKAIRTIGEGSFSLDDLDESFDDSKHSSPKEPTTKDEKTVQELMPDVTFASEKRNNEFHKIFSNYIDQNEHLIEDHSCAHTREILVQGRFYITPHHVCFHSNILGRTTHFVVSFQEILDIKPKNTVGLFPNGIVIRSLHAQHTFASFVNREHVLKLLLKLKDSPLNRINSSDANESDLANGIDLDSSPASEDDVDGGEWNEVSSFKRRRSSDSFSFNSSNTEMEDEAPSRARSRSAPSMRNGTKENNKDSPKEAGGGGAGGDGAAKGKWPVENIGPDTHKPTSMPEMDSKEKLIETFTVPAPLGVVANLMYGKDSSWYYQFQTADLKNRELESIPPFKDQDGKKQRYFEYIKPLNGPVGPKQTKCKVTETQESWDMEDKVVILIAVKTPDVPSGDAFVTYTKCTMVWAEDNKTSIRHTTWLEWSGKSWLKKPIENGAIDGQQQYCKALNTALNGKLRNKSGGGSKPRKSKRKERKSHTQAPPPPPPSRSFDPLTIGLGVIGVVAVFFLVRFIYHHTFGGPSAQRQLLQQQLDLWQWLDSRLENKSSFDKVSESLTAQEIEEVIKLTELRLGRLRAIKNERIA